MCIEAKDAVTWWTLDPGTLAIVLLPSVTYLHGLRRLWRDAPRGEAGAGPGHGIRRWEAACFWAGQMAIFVALISPLDRLSDVLFSAHMAQHEVLILVAPPLVVLGRPWVALMWALPARARTNVAAWLRRRSWRMLWRGSSDPLLVLIVHAVVVWAWHAPVLFEAALRDELVHALQHASFFATAALFWWAILRGRYGRLGYGIAVAFVFATAMHTSVLGALITLAGRLWYPLYAVRGKTWQLDPLEDQTLAGLVMWVPAGVLMTMMALGLFAAWLGEAERRVSAAERRRLE